MKLSHELIDTFYSAFQKKDSETMKGCYLSEATFKDEVFKNLNGYQAGKMWEMLLKNGKDMQMVYEITDDNVAFPKAKWTATYTFSKTGRKVVNVIYADFVIKEGKILTHTDTFDFHRWAKQAFGPMGVLLGWTGFFKTKIQKTVSQTLENYIAKHP
jgi:hypothetical protein